MKTINKINKDNKINTFNTFNKDIKIDTFTEGQYAVLRFVKENLKAQINRLENVPAEEILRITMVDNVYAVKFATTLETKKHFLKQIEEYEKQMK